MKTFEQFLYEMPQLVDLGPPSKAIEYPSKRGDKISELNGHSIHRVRGYGFVVRDHQYNPVMRVSGNFHRNNPSHFEITMAERRADSTLRYHDLLHHLITNHDMHIYSDNIHSFAAAKTWKKLSQRNDVEVRHVDRDGNPLEMHRGDQFKHNYRQKGHLQTSRFVATKRTLAESQRSPERAIKLLRYIAQRRAGSNPWGTKTVQNFAPEYGAVPQLPRGYRWTHAGEHEVDLASIKSNQASVYSDGVESKIRGKSQVRMRGFAHPNGTNYLQDGNHSYHALRLLGAKTGKMDLHVARKITDADV